jgi:hypothetical protein
VAEPLPLRSVSTPFAVTSRRTVIEQVLSNPLLLAISTFTSTSSRVVIRISMMNETPVSARYARSACFRHAVEEIHFEVAFQTKKSQFTTHALAGIMDAAFVRLQSMVVDTQTVMQFVEMQHPTFLNLKKLTVTDEIRLAAARPTESTAEMAADEAARVPQPPVESLSAVRARTAGHLPSSDLAGASMDLSRTRIQRAPQRQPLRHRVDRGCRKAFAGESVARED